MRETKVVSVACVDWVHVNFTLISGKLGKIRNKVNGMWNYLVAQTFLCTSYVGEGISMWTMGLLRARTSYTRLLVVPSGPATNF